MIYHFVNNYCTHYGPGVGHESHLFGTTILDRTLKFDTFIFIVTIYIFCFMAPEHFQ